MKKGLIIILLTFILIFNTYSPTFATSLDPAAAIPVTAYEVYTYFTLVLTYMGVEYKNSQERKQWLEDEYGPDTPTYQSVEDILRQAKINFSNEPPNYNPKPEPRQIAIPVPDSLIDSISDKIMSLFNQEVPNDELSAYEYFSTNSNPDRIYFFYAFNKPGSSIRYSSWSIPDYCTYKLENDPMYGLVYKAYSSDGSVFKFTKINYTSNYSSTGSNSSVSMFKSIDDYYTFLFTLNAPTLVTIPDVGLITSWTSPYTGMQTVTMPLTTTGIESPVEVPVIPGEYVEPAPDEVTNPIQNPEGDPLINPETGLPFIDPETGLPIFPSTPLVPVTPITPIPEPEELTQPKDYTPNLTEISNGIKQLPERIINPIKKLFIPDKVSKIDFSPLNVPITKKFPFSIPFDLANMFQNFSAGGEPPKWDINLVFMDYSETVTIDLARFEKWAEITRFFVFIGFNIGLILVTRNLIRG